MRSFFSLSSMMLRQVRLCASTCRVCIYYTLRSDGPLRLYPKLPNWPCADMLMATRHDTAPRASCPDVSVDRGLLSQLDVACLCFFNSDDTDADV